MLKKILWSAGAVVLAIPVVALMFGDNAHHLFGASADALAGQDQVPLAGPASSALTRKSMRNFVPAENDGSYQAPAAQPAAAPSPNRVTEVREDRLSTFAIDVDTASYTLGRRYLSSGTLPVPGTVRVEEWVNAFQYQLQAPLDAPFAVQAEGAPSPFNGGRTLLKVSIKGREVAAADRKVAHLVFLVDTSCSMQGADRLDLAKQSLQLLSKNLNPRDTVALVTYAGDVREVLAPTPASHRREIAAAIDSLTTGGGTAMGSGLELAYRLAVRQVARGEVSRVLVLTDGDTNLGRNQTAESMLAAVRGYVQEGVTLTAVGFGMGNYRDGLMEKLADSGDGQVVYIDGEREARRVFEQQLAGTLEVIAKDVKVQVDFSADAVKSYRLLGYENRGVADADFRNDRVDGGEIGAGHNVTAVYELELASHPQGTLATVRVRGMRPDSGQAFELAVPVTAEVMRPSLAGASTELRFAAAVAGAADLLRGNAMASNFSLVDARALAAGATRDLPERLEFVALLDRAIGLTGGEMLTIKTLPWDGNPPPRPGSQY